MIKLVKVKNIDDNVQWAVFLVCIILNDVYDHHDK